MSQRILEPGQIETLARSDIPRTRLAGRDSAFGRRASRLRSLGGGSTIGGYLQLLAVIADAQQAALETLLAEPSTLQGPTPGQRQASAQAKMPPFAANAVPGGSRWQGALRWICGVVAGHAQFPAEVQALVARISAVPESALQAQAQALLDPPRDTAVDAAAAPLVMAALQVWWVALTSPIEADAVQALDVPGVCPLCGSLPVVSVVHARKPYEGYRYLHCALCACEWHMVRVQCSSCGAMGKDVAYHSLRAVDAGEATGKAIPAVRAETCDRCRGYRKILYMEKDPALDPIADDLGTLALDLLLGEQGYQRASANPLFWQPGQP
jgi:FdhE protein